MPASYLNARMRSIGNALRGLGLLIRTQPNARIHLAATAAVCAAGAWFGLSAIEWCLIAVAVFCVWMAEAFNTALESLVDLASPELHPLAARAKDAAAGAVLVAAIGALVIGVIIFAPRLWAMLF